MCVCVDGGVQLRLQHQRPQSSTISSTTSLRPTSAEDLQTANKTVKSEPSKCVERHFLSLSYSLPLHLIFLSRASSFPFPSCCLSSALIFPSLSLHSAFFHPSLFSLVLSPLPPSSFSGILCIIWCIGNVYHSTLPPSLPLLCPSTLLTFSPLFPTFPPPFPALHSLCYYLKVTNFCGY